MKAFRDLKLKLNGSISYWIPHPSCAECLLFGLPLSCAHLRPLLCAPGDWPYGCRSRLPCPFASETQPTDGISRRLEDGRIEKLKALCACSSLPARPPWATSKGYSSCLHRVHSPTPGSFSPGSCSGSQGPMPTIVGFPQPRL